MNTDTPTSPLAAIEAAVQRRAKDEAVDAAGDEGLLRHLIDDEIARWRDEHRRGLRAFDLDDPTNIMDRAVRNLTGHGPLGPLLDDDDVWEIMVNAPDQIFVKRHRGPSGYHDEVFHDDEHVSRTLTKILDESGAAHRKLDPTEGLQDAQLASGARVHVVHPDLARDGHTIINIRKFTGVSIRRLDELVQTQTLDHRTAQFLRACVGSDLSMVFAGAPGAGKTTLMSCCAAELAPDRRVVIAEEVFEADVPLANVAGMQTRGARPDRPEIDLRRLVAGFLRMAPDVAIVGEVRDREALPLLLTLSSGVTGFTTIHAGSARQALGRLRFVAQLAATDLPMAALNTLVSDSIDVVVHSVRTPAGPQVSEVLCVEELVGAADSAQFTATSVLARDPRTGNLQATGATPHRVGAALERSGFLLSDLLGTHG
ncbi:MAG: CpaF family protein [Acidimicrobiales bacterium]